MTCSEQVKRFDNGACGQLSGARLYGMQAFRALWCIGIVIAHSAAYAEINDSYISYFTLFCSSHDSAILLAFGMVRANVQYLEIQHTQPLLVPIES